MPSSNPKSKRETFLEEAQAAPRMRQSYILLRLQICCSRSHWKKYEQRVPYSGHLNDTNLQQSYQDIEMPGTMLPVRRWNDRWQQLLSVSKMPKFASLESFLIVH